MKLMIVDDHAGMREMIRQIAASPGDEICECKSGSEAVQRAAEFAPDWVTMDLRMPGISGLDATRAIMTVRPSASIVVVSSYDIAELRRAATDAGAKGFVAKDNLYELKSQIRPPDAQGLETTVCTSTNSTQSPSMTSSPFFFASSKGISQSAQDLPALAQTSERYRLLLENSVDVVVEASREGEILYVSSNVREVFGYTVAELMHGSIFARVHPEDVPKVTALFALPQGRGTCRYRHKDGTWRWIETNGREFLAADGIVRSVLVVRDITDRIESDAIRHNLEEELNRSTKLSALGLLAGEIAHDFNNLLTVINVHLGMAQMDTQDPEVQNSLTQVEQAVEQAKQLAQQVLQFSRQQNAEHHLVRLPTLIEDVMQLLRPTWPEGVEIVTDLPAESGWIMASPTQLHQVLSNLFVNAAHAMKSGAGRLDIRVDSLHVEKAYADPKTSLACGRYVQLTVSDNGHGMDAATQQRIFEPFFTTKGHGTGLGLAVVQRVIKDHSASIRMSSEPGKGTTFRIYFTAAPGPLAAANAS
jgi:PAS domain S-box-containing protein